MNKKEEIKSFVLKKLRYLEAMETHGNTNVELARLRRGVGKSPGEIPELYGIFLKDMPEKFWNRRGESGKVSEAEWSCYITLTLYAIHQQGNTIKTKNMHTDDYVSIGTALRQMVLMQTVTDKANTENRLQQKLQMLITSKDVKEFSYHLRNVIKLLKSNGIAINYVKLAGDIYDFQFAESKNRISLAWGHDFYRVYKEEKENE